MRLDFSPTAESFGVSAQTEVRFHEGSRRVPSPEFHQVLPGLRGGPGWFEVRFHEGSTRVPPGSARAVGWSGVVEVGSTRVPPEFHQAARG